MDLVQLKYFEMVAKTGNVSKAAEKLFVTQPNLSKSISRLEDELKVPLFDHRKGKIVLNEYGRVFLSSVELAFHELDHGRQAILKMYETNQNVLRLGCCVEEFLPDMLHGFTQRYPEVGIRQVSCAMDGIADKLLDQSADLIITSEPVDNENIKYLEFGRQEYVLLMNREHPLSGRDEVELEELREDKFICDSSRMSLSKLQSICRTSGFKPEVLYEVESSALIFRLLEMNSGISLMPMPQVLKLQRQMPQSRQRIRVTRIRDEIPKASIGFAYHRGYEFTYAAKCLLEYIQEFFQEENRALEQIDITSQ